MLSHRGENDISREKFTLQKGLQFFRVLFWKGATHVLGAYRMFPGVESELLKKNGIKGIILDVDDCISYHHGAILPQNYFKIRQLLDEGFHIVIFSNMKKTPRYSVLEDWGIPVITSVFPKPDPRGFEECRKKLNLPPHQMVMIGDNYLTDGGALQAGMHFIKIKPLPVQKEGLSSKRWIQILFRTMTDWLAEKIYKTLQYK